jgi:pyrimidine operon attenuation protein/uracil phosphoribosyltransferase
MSKTPVSIDFYIRPSGSRIYRSIPLADDPDWEIWRQAIQVSKRDGISLVEEVLATGLTLRKAWAAMVAIANPKQEKPE